MPLWINGKLLLITADAGNEVNIATDLNIDGRAQQDVADTGSRELLTSVLGQLEEIRILLQGLHD